MVNGSFMIVSMVRLL